MFKSEDIEYLTNISSCTCTNVPLEAFIYCSQRKKSTASPPTTVYVPWLKTNYVYHEIQVLNFTCHLAKLLQG